MPGDLKETQIHRTVRLAVPWGGAADIDVVMVPLVQRLWSIGLETSGCCQDLGEAIEHNGHGSTAPSHGRRRHADFHKGHAWLRMPVTDAARLMGILGRDPIFRERVRRWTHPEAWQAVVYLFPIGDGDADLVPTAQISFPADQIPDLMATLRG